MSSSDQDMSDTSNLESPYSQMPDSPYSSPSQQVPHLANFLNVLTCTESYNKGGNGGPYLRILEQPQDHFRFRYRSEMIGTHGCLLGKASSSSKTKTHPTVELVNFKKKALIRCRLAQVNNEHEHPHKLLEDDQDRDVSTEVPEGGSYKVGFGGMGIIHTAKKDVPALLFKKYAATAQNMNEKDLRVHCENLAKGINLNIVRLRFSAHDLDTDEEICPAVFSEPIHNMKSAATNDLKICRISRCSGSPRGGDDVFILVEKVNKKNIKVRFFELGPNGDEVWSADGGFLQNDVHHQYAIVFRTPKYRDMQIGTDVKVFVELLRPSDGRTSESREFTYKADPVYRQNKKRKANSSYSSIDSSSGASLNSIDLPVSIQAINNANKNMDMGAVKPEQMLEIKYPNHIPRVPQVSTTTDSLMAQALMHDLSASVTLFPAINPQSSPQMHFNIEQTNSSVGPPVLQLDSTEMESIINGSIPPEERRQFEDYSHDFLKSFDSFPLNKMTMFTSDSGRVKEEPKPTSPVNNEPSVAMDEDCRSNKNNDYTAFYTAENGTEVKKLVKELCEIIRNKTGYKKQVVRDKLERLFDMRLSNGDTFLHMTLCSNQSSLEYIVKLIHSMKMTHLLNLRNHRLRTILHLAVENDSPKLVSFLVSKGCDPMAEDKDGNNAIHYAVIYQNCLVTLLDAIKDNKVPYDINAYNNEKQTALHLATVYCSGESVRELLERGADRNVRDAAARTALHLAAYDDALPAVRALLQDIPLGEVDLVDGQGQTALQIVCSGDQKENTLEILKLLLDNKADPKKHEENIKPAWMLCSDKPAMWGLMQEYESCKNILEHDIEVKSEPEDDYESADEGELSPMCLEELNRYVDRISKMLDLSGAWRILCARLNKESLVPCFASEVSPTRALLEHIQRCGSNLTSLSLAAILETIGQQEAAKIVLSYVQDSKPKLETTKVGNSNMVDLTVES